MKKIMFLALSFVFCGHLYSSNWPLTDCADTFNKIQSRQILVVDSNLNPIRNEFLVIQAVQNLHDACNKGLLGHVPAGSTLTSMQLENDPHLGARLLFTNGMRQFFRFKDIR